MQWLFDRINQHGTGTALVTSQRDVTYAEIMAYTREWDAAFHTHSGEIVGFSGEFTANAIGLLLSLIGRGAIAVPIAPVVKNVSELLAIIGCDLWIDRKSSTLFQCDPKPPAHLIAKLNGDPGLVLFSSGSTGKPKAALHNFRKLLAKFEKPGRIYRLASFLLFDHIGGINTLFAALSSGGTVVALKDRNPDALCAAIGKYHIEVLPTTPTFLNMMLISEEYKVHDLSSLRLITYGTELMPESTLRRLREALPDVELRQTYGLSELGILRTKSESSDSLWVKVGGKGYETKVQDGTLWIRAESSMVGYFNAPDPFDAEGWFDTGDLVEERDGYVRFLGRRNEVINVGGEKVYPAEVESVLLEAPNVADALVTAEPNVFVGQVVAAQVVLKQPEEFARARLREWCMQRLEAYKVPARITIVEGGLHSPRYKKVRGNAVRDVS